MKALLILATAIAAISTTGCGSEVDKCVAAWESANPGPDNGGDWCESYFRDDKTGKCSPEHSMTKGQVKAEVRLECLRASKGQ